MIMRCKNPLVMKLAGGFRDEARTLPSYNVIGSLKRIHDFDPVKDKLIPCGHCIACRINYSSDWANRMLLESQYYGDDNWFVTLTYDNEHLPPDLNGVFDSPFHTLVKDEVSSFMKRLRRYSGQKIRFYACGEYGSERARPHYHIIIFGLHLDASDLKFWKFNHQGDALYTSQLIERAWSLNGVPFGLHCVAQVNWETCAYTARYVTKKLNGDAAAVYDDAAIIPEFSVMSRKPGIGRLYYDDHVEEIFENREIIVSTSKGGKTFKPPKYYDRLYDIDYPEQSLAHKKRVEHFIQVNNQLRGNYTSMSLLEELAAEENALERRTKSLVRSDCD